MPGFWRKCRLTFRFFRLLVWGVVLLGLCAFAWFDFVGLPGFLKTRLVTALHERGVALEFSRMRLRPVHGLVCDNVRIGGAEKAGNPLLLAGAVQVRLDFSALFRRRVQINGLVLRAGQLEFPISSGNVFAFTNLETELHFETDDSWFLDRFHAELRGIKIDLSGTLAHAPDARNWPIFSGGNKGAALSNQLLQAISQKLAQISFSAPPQLKVKLSGDARDFHSLAFNLTAAIPGARSPWFVARDFQLTTTLTASGAVPANFEPAWDFWTNLQPFQVTWAMHAAELSAIKIKAETVVCAGSWHSPELVLNQVAARFGSGGVAASANLDVATRQLTFTNNSTLDLNKIVSLLPEEIRLQLAQVSWNLAPLARLGGMIALPAWSRRDWNWNNDLAAATQLQGELAVTNGMIGRQPLDYLCSHLIYSNFVWQVKDLQVAHQQTMLDLNGRIDERTKEFFSQVRGEIDAATLKPFLPETNVQRLQFSKTLHLSLAANGRLDDLGQTAGIGCLAVTNFYVDGVKLDFAKADFSISNQVWFLQDLVVAQQPTQLHLSGRVNPATKSFAARLQGAFDSASLLPFLKTDSAVRGFHWLAFHEPLVMDVAAQGDFLSLDHLFATGHIALANFAIRDQSVDYLTADLVYSNWMATFLHPYLSRAAGAEKFSAESVAVDIAGQRLFFTNGIGNVEPMVVGRAIGPKTAKAMEPYHFLAIPTARVNGCVPLRHKNGDVVNDDADLNVDIIGTTPFRWMKFQTPAITGTIHWLANDLIITNVISECYGGEAHGWAGFDLQTPGDGTDFNFFVAGTNVDFHRMGMALWSPTNQLEGSVSGAVTVTRANSDYWRTWNGFGALKLRDGMLWDVPVFGLVSPVLNTVSPGFGNSRAKDAAGEFLMTNGIIWTGSLVIRTPMMRLDYDGTVDLQEKVNARVTAQLLRNTPLVGPILSLLFSPFSKAFECEVTGTLGDPKVAPVYVPDLLLVPLHPFRSVEIFFAPTPVTPPAGK